MLESNNNKTYKPNFTAWFVLQGVLVAMRHPAFTQLRQNQSLAFYEALAKAASNTRLLSSLIYRLPNQLQYRIGELVTTPGRLRHYFLRKSTIEKHVRQCLADGCTQIVILGAGLDVLSLQLAQEYPQAKFIEIDLPDSQEFKIRSLKSQNIVIPDNIEFIHGDLRNPLVEVLAPSVHYTPAAKTLWLAEGLLMFIPEPSVRDIFAAAKKSSTPESLFLFTSLPCKEQGGVFARKLQEFYLKKEDSQLNWAIDFLDVEAFMHSLGYTLSWQMNYAELHQDFLLGADKKVVNIGENLHLASM